MAAPIDDDGGGGAPNALYDEAAGGAELSLRPGDARQVREWFRARAADIDLCERTPGSVWPAFLHVRRELGRGHYGRAAEVVFRPDPEGAPLAHYYVALKRVEIASPAALAEVDAEINYLQTVSMRISMRTGGVPGRTEQQSDEARQRIQALFPSYYFHWHCVPGSAGADRPRVFVPHATFVVMTLMSGNSLLSVMHAEYAARRPALETLDVVRGVLYAVAETCYVMDALGVRHRDSHGGNVIIGDEASGVFRAQFIDFGRAEFTSSDRGRFENGTNFMDFLVMMLTFQQLPTEVGRAVLAELFTEDTRRVLAMRHSYRWFGVPQRAGYAQWDDVYYEYFDGRAMPGDVEQRHVLMSSAFATAGGVGQWITNLTARVEARLTAAAVALEEPRQ